MTVLLSRKLEVGSCVFVSDLFIFGGWGLSSGERGVRGGGRKVVYRGRCFRLTELLQPSPSLLGTVLLQLSTSLEMPWEREHLSRHGLKETSEENNNPQGRGRAEKYLYDDQPDDHLMAAGV